jgi:Uma2 family endonuclease
MAPIPVQAGSETKDPVKQPAARRRPPIYDNLPPDYPVEAIPNLDHVVVQDDAPVDGIQTERDMRLLIEPLHTSWTGPGEGRPFIALANVGIFYASGKPPIVPDVMLSLDVTWSGDLEFKEYQSYFVWIVGKVPEVAIEIVSNREGGEDDKKMHEYARLRIQYYVIFDPRKLLSEIPLRIYELRRGHYQLMEGNWLEEVGLGLTIWRGTYQGVSGPWLRWCDKDSHLIPTGEEARDQERQRAEKEKERAEKEKERAEKEKERAEAAEKANRVLLEKLRALGIDVPQAQ